MSQSPGIPSALSRRARRAKRKLVAMAPGRILSTMRARAAGRTPRHVLLLSDGLAYTSEQQFAPLIRHAGAIAARTGFVFTFGDMARAQSLAPETLKRWHMVGLKLGFATPGDEAEALASHVFETARLAGAHAVYFDGDDDQGVLWPKVIAASDAYIKKHRFADIDAYTTGWIGKSNLTDYSHRKFGVSFADDIIPETGPLAASDISKIVLGWNIALDDKIADLAEDIPASALAAPRPVDILCRASVGSTLWTFGMRDTAVQAIEALEGRKVHAPTDRVPQDAYYREMLSARLSVSPYGFGELCWRDFESILSGSVLVKPDMGHVATEPDLFVPHETYVPVAWDYSDLAEAIAPYLDDEEKRRAMAETARARLLTALDRAWFLDRFEATMSAAGVL